MGNDRLHQLTWSPENTEILVELESTEGDVYYPMYNGFKVANEDDKYRLSIGDVLDSAIGTPFDKSVEWSGLKRHDNVKFSTVDNDNDDVGPPCPPMPGECGWWYNYCYSVNVNGIYGDDTQSMFELIVWEEISYRNPELLFYFTKTKLMFRKKLV